MSVNKNEISDANLEWLKESFLSVNDTRSASARRDVYSSTRLKYTSTEPGGMIYMNPLPQFCRYTDLRVPNRLSRIGTGGDPISNNIYYDPDIRGLGDIYSRVFDDSAQVVHFRWGVPSFNSLTSFWGTFYNRDMGTLARNGRVDSGLFSFIGNAIGCIFAIPFVPFILVGRMWRFFTNAPANKYWYVTPAMPLLWTAMNTMVNSQAVNLGMVPRTFRADQQAMADASLEGGGADRSSVDAYMKTLHQFMPDIFREDGGIDIYRLANRASRINHKENEKFRELISTSSPEELTQRIQEYVNAPIDTPDEYARNIEVALKQYMESGFGKKESDGKDIQISEQARRTQYDENGNALTNAVGSAVGAVAEKWGDINELLDAELADGSAFISYRVNHTGTITESFSNSTTKPEIFETINEKSRSARSRIYNFSGGNISDGIVGGTIEAVTASIGDMIGGALDTIGLGGLAVAAGAALVATQELWEESIASIPEQTYTVDLIAISSDPLSILLDIYIPLFGLLVPAMPRSTGSSSYTGPMVGEMFDRGRCISRNTMITSITIERGNGDVGWAADGLPLSIKVTFTAKDLNTMLSMPIAAAWSFDPLKMLMPDDTPWNDYMSVLGNLSMRDVVYPLAGKLSINLANYGVRFRSWASLSRVVNHGIGNTDIGRFWQGITREMDRSR